MRPYGWLPDCPQWTQQDISEHNDMQNLEVQFQGNEIVQRLGNRVLATEVPDHRNRSQEIEQTIEVYSNTNRINDSIEKLWTGQKFSGRILFDSKPNLEPDFLQSKYEQTSLNHEPLSSFSKQVLAKMRNNLEPQEFLTYLTPLLVTPTESDKKYAHEESADASTLVAKIRNLDDGMRPLVSVLQEFKIRETQSQIVLGIEALSLDERCETALDHHFDRLCIWQAVKGPSSLVNDFCAAVLLPYFKTKAPKKVKELIRINRGTLKSRSKSSKSASLPSSSKASLINNAALPKAGSLPLTGLAKASHMQNSSSNSTTDPSKAQLPTAPVSKRRNASDLSAYRSVSHPVYKQESSQSCFEVKFRKSRVSKHRSMRNKVKPTLVSSTAVSSPTTEWASTPPIQEISESKESSIVQIEDDIISSTDSD